MNLQEMAMQHLENFDAKKDNPNSFDNDGLPEGRYDVVIEEAGHRVYDSGFDAVAFSLEVVTGDHAGRKELINIDLDGEAVQTYDFLAKKNIRLIAKMAEVTGVQLSEEDWLSEDTVGSAFRHTVGTQLILDIEKGETKKGKSFTNYSFEAYPDDEDYPEKDTIEIDDEDLPF